MKQSTLTLEAFGDNAYRTIFKNHHGRVVYLSLSVRNNICTITDCFYPDRNQGRAGADRYRSKPLMLRTFKFPLDKLLDVIEAELDKKFYGIEYVRNENFALPLDEYIQVKLAAFVRKYNFLIMVGEGKQYNGLPERLRTRLKNKLHRSIYVELRYYKDGRGVVAKCCYYDRSYKRQDISVTPSMLTSCFFPYNREAIINLLNNEICCDFTHMIVTDGIDVEINPMPLCGSL